MMIVNNTKWVCFDLLFSVAQHYEHVSKYCVLFFCSCAADNVAT